MTIDDLRRKQVEIAMALCTHPAQTFDDYNRRVGRYIGLEEIIRDEEARLEDARRKDSRL